ncbi:unnamed protein product [Prunus armeniaca]
MHREEPPKSSGKDFLIFPRVKCHGLLHGCISQRTKASVPSLISMSFTYAIARLRVEIEKETHACDVPVV